MADPNVTEPKRQTSAAVAPATVVVAPMWACQGPGCRGAALIVRGQPCPRCRKHLLEG